MPQLTIPLPKKDKERLTRLALRYGFSLPEFSLLILTQLPDEIPSESFDDYDNPNELRASFARAIKDWKAGRVSQKL